MPALAWVPLSDAAAKRLYALAKAEKISPEELAGRVIAEFTGSAKARRVVRQQATADKAADNPYELLAKLEKPIERHWKAHPNSRTGTEGIILTAVALLREVGNGGFDQFFRNSSRRWAGFAPDAMRHIGRKDAARIAKRAVRALGKWETPAEFEALMNKPNPRRDEALNECDIAFYQLEGLAESVLAHARAHPDGLLRK